MKNENILLEIKSLEQLIFKKLISVTKCNLNILSTTQIRIIDYIIQNNNKIYQKDLEKTFNLTRATISEVLKTMEKNNLIERFTSIDDARVKEIKLSKKSIKIFNENKHKLIELENNLTKNINPSDLKIFSNVITKMKQNIKREDDL